MELAMAASAESRERELEIIRQHIGCRQDFPKPGILFRDIFPTLRVPKVFNTVISIMVETIKLKTPTANLITAIEARGFLFGPVIASKMDLPFAPFRKPGKLPGPTHTVGYQLEYGCDALEASADAFTPTSQVVIVDDLLATAGTMQAACKLVENAGGRVVLCLTVMELLELRGSEKLNVPFTSIIQF